MSIDFTKLQPVSVEVDPNEEVSAIIKMQPGRKPSKYRMRIVDDIYTIDTTRGEFDRLQKSDDVISITLNEKLSMIGDVPDK
jgi:hypothetical protein